MAGEDKNIVYKLQLVDDGITRTFVLTADAGKKMGEDISSSAEKAAASLNKMSAASDKAGASQAKLSAEAKVAAESTAAGFAMNEKMASNALWWMSAVGKGQDELIKKDKTASEERKKGTEEIQKQEVAASSLGRTMERIQRTIAAFAAVYVFQKITTGLSEMVKAGMEFNAVMEESKLGMASIFMAQGEFIAASGNALQGTEALNSAMQMSSKISKELQLDNLKTAATYQQLVKAYQQTIAPGLSVGFNPEQIRQYTVAMVQAASALGLNLDMLAEETRSMLRGAITPRNTLIATALGIRNEDINKYKGDVDALYKYVMGRLSAFGIAGEAVQMTWKGAMSNIKDVIQMALGEGFTNLFDYLKKQALEIQKSMVKWDVNGPQLNQEVVDTFKAMGQAIIEIIEGTKTWAKYLSGILPVFGLIYQLLRTMGIALTPFVGALGLAVTYAGSLASSISGTLKGINDTVDAVKPLQLGLAAAAGYLVYMLGISGAIGAFAAGTALPLVSKIALALSGWAGPLAASLAIMYAIGQVFPNLISNAEIMRLAVMGISAAWLSSLGPLGKVAAAIMLLVEAKRLLDAPLKWMDRTLDNLVGRTPERRAQIDAKMGISPSAAEQAKINEDLSHAAEFKQRAIELDKAQKDELSKIAAITGELSESDRKRLTVLNDLTKMYSDSFGDMNKQIESLKGGLDLTKLMSDNYQEGTRFFKSQEDGWKKLAANAREFTTDMANLPIQEQEALLKLAEMVEKSVVPPEIISEAGIKEYKANLYRQLESITLEKIRIGVKLEVYNIDLQIVTQNKNYAEQLMLVEEITKEKIRQMELDHKLDPGKVSALREAMNDQGAQQLRMIRQQQEQEALGWKEQISNANVYWATMAGEIEQQVAAETKSFDLKQESARVGLKYRDAETQVAFLAMQAAEKKVFSDQESRKIALDTLNYESKISALKSSAAQMTGNYELEAQLLHEQYVTNMSILAVQGNISKKRLEELSLLHGVTSAYKAQEVMINGAYDIRKKTLDLQNSITAFNEGDAAAMGIQLELLNLQVQKEKDLLSAKIAASAVSVESGGGVLITQDMIDKTNKIIALMQKWGQMQITEKPLADWVAFYDGIESAATKWYNKQLELIERNRKANEVYYGIEAAASKADQDLREAKLKLFEKENLYINSTISNTEKMFDSASTLYAKDSSQYKAIQEMKKVALIAEMAQEARKQVIIMTGIITSMLMESARAKEKAALVAADVLYGGAQVATNEAVAVSGAAASVAAQGTVPYAGFALAAAMAAFMAAILGAAGIAFNGSGGSAPSAPVLPASTVLGAEAGTGSSSIANSYKLLQDTYSMEYRELTSIYNILKQLNDNITGLVTSIVRTGTVGTGAGVNIKGFDPGNAQVAAMGTLGRFFTGMMSPLGLMGGMFAAFSSNKLTDLANKWFSDAIGSIFGGGTKQTLEGAGIEFKAAKVGDLIAGEMVDAIGYQIIKTVKDGGWFRKDQTSYSTIFTALGDDVNHLFTLVFKGMGQTLVEIAKGLGTDVQAALDYVFEGTKIDLRGKSGEDINKILSEYFSKVGDEAVTALFGSILGKYQKLNEGLFETATRLVMDMAVVQQILDITGQHFDGTRLQMVDFSETLIEMAGGLDVLTKAAQEYYDKFFTDAEKAARTQSQVSAALADLNLVLPDTRAGYKNLIESLDLTTEAGKEAYIALLNLAASADAVYAAQEKIASDWDDLMIQLLGLQGKTSEALAAQRQKDLAAADPQLRALMGAIYAQEDYNAAVKETTDATKAYNDALATVISATKAVASATEKLTSAQESAAKAEAKIVDAQNSYAKVVQDGAQSILDAQSNYAISLTKIISAQKAYVDAQKALADEILKQQRDALEAQLKVEADARKAEIDAMKKQKDFMDAQVKLLDDQLKAQQDIVTKLQDISKTVKQWVAGMSTSTLAPVLSRDAFEAEYQRLKSIASAPGAQQADITSFLDYAKQYLEFQRAYGGDYQAIFDTVMADVQSIGDAADQQLIVAQAQLAATQAADEAAKISAQQIADAIVAAQAADEVATAAGQELLKSLDTSAADGVQRLIDLQIKIDEAAQGIIDAQLESDKAYAAIAAAQAQAVADTNAALAAIADAEAAAAKAQAAIAQATADLAAAQQALLDAQNAVPPLLERMINAQEAQVMATNNLADAMYAFAHAIPPVGSSGNPGGTTTQPPPVTPPPTVGGAGGEAIFPPGTMFTGQPGYSGAAFPWIIARQYAWNPLPFPPGAPEWGDVSNSMYIQSMMYSQFGRGIPPRASLPWPGDPIQTPYGMGGLALSPSTFGESGPEWAVPAYEPERSRFLKSAPDSFWENLGGGTSKGEGVPIEITLHSVTNLDGKVLAENTTKQILRSGPLNEAIQAVAKRVKR